MSYINLINAFWSSRKRASLKPSTIALYFSILDSCNEGRWENPFATTSPDLIKSINITDDTLTSCLRQLKNTGFIDFDRRTGSKNLKIELLNLPKNSGTSSVGSSVGSSVAFENSDPTPISIIKEDKRVKTEAKARKVFSPPSLEEVIDYFIEKEHSEDEARYYFDYRTKYDWKVKNDPIKDYKADIRNWITRQKKWDKTADGIASPKNKLKEDLIKAAQTNIELLKNGKFNPDADLY